MSNFLKYFDIMEKNEDLCFFLLHFYRCLNPLLVAYSCPVQLIAFSLLRRTFPFQYNQTC